MLNKIKFLKKGHDRENGMTIVEVMVAFVIIAILLVATGQTLMTASRVAATNENRSKASNLASDIIAVGKQVDYRQLWIPAQTNLGYSANDILVDNQAHCRPWVGTGTAATGAPRTSNVTSVLKYCDIVSFGYNNSSNGTGAGKEVGTRFHVQTQVKYVNGGADRLPKKRIEVTVRWQDVYAGENGFHEYRTTYTRSPSMTDCIDGATRTRITGCEA